MSQSQKEAAEYAEVLMAYSRGERIQMRPVDNQTWQEPTYPLWDFARFEYRVAPKPVEAWVTVDAGGNILHSPKGSTREDCANRYSGKNRAILMREVTEWI